MRWPLLILAACLLLAVLIVTAIPAFYLEENSRGARAWHDTQARLRAQGEGLDWTDLIPPRIPDAQNLGSLDLFQVAPDPQTNGALEPMALRHALENISSADYHLPIPGRWMLGEPADFAALQKNLAARYQEIIQPGPHAAMPNALSALNALCPALEQIRTAAAARPLCRFNRDYVSQPPDSRPLGPVTKLISLAQALNLHAVLAIHAQQSDLALADIETSLKIDSGLRQEPILVSGLVAVGVLAVQTGSVWEGLHLHAWNDAQLATLQRDFSGIDFLSEGQLCLRSEAIGYIIPNMDHLRDQRLSAAKTLTNLAAMGQQSPPFADWLFWAAPRGWVDLGKNLSVTTLFKAAREAIDPASRRVFPTRADQLWANADSLNPEEPWNLLPHLSLPPLLACIPAFAQGQSRVDAARIACMLERYHLAHGAYPDTLEALRSYDPNGPPSDLINGQPFHYGLRKDGTYLLYSVGWNQTDDGGKIAYQPDSTTAIDRKQGDWVWP